MSRSDDFLLTAEELRLRRQKRRRLTFAVVTLVLLLVLGSFFARPASHAIKAWQARRHAREAFEFIAQEKWTEAQKEATAAYQLAPNEPEATRAVARFLSRVRQPQALEFWERLATQQPLNRDDLRDQAAVALALGETERAAAAIKSLLANEGRDATPGDWLLDAQLEAQRGAPNESAAALQKVFAISAATLREQLQAAVLALRLAGGDSEQDQKNQADAWQRIEKLSAGKDSAGLDALVLLAQRALANQRSEVGGPAAAGELRSEKGATPSLSSPNDSSSTASASSESLTPSNKSKTVNREPGTESAKSAISNQPSAITQIALAIDSHPLAQAPQKLLAIDLRIHTSPNEKEALIQSAIEQWKNADNEAFVALATWLNGKGEFQRELDTIPLQRAVQSRGLFLQHVDALGALGHWEEIKAILNGNSFPLDAMIQDMYLARCYAQLGQETAGANNWQRALEAAAGDPQKLMTLADYAEKNGATAIATTAYDTVIASAPRLRAAWQRKLRLAQAERDTKKIHGILAGMLQQWPNDSAVQNDEAYLRLLLLPSVAGSERKAETLKTETLKLDAASPITNNQELITISQLAEALIAREPASLPHRTLLALVYLKQNRPATALGVYENLHVPPSALTPTALTVHAAVLQANGNTADAAKEAEQVPRGALLPEEAALISGL